MLASGACQKLPFSSVVRGLPGVRGRTPCSRRGDPGSTPDGGLRSHRPRAEQTRSMAPGGRGGTRLSSPLLSSVSCALCLPEDTQSEVQPGVGSRWTGSQTSCPHARWPVRAQPHLPTASGSPTGQRTPRAGFWKAAQQHLHPDCGGVGPGRRAEWSAHPHSSVVPLPTCRRPSRPAVALPLSGRALWCPRVAVAARCCRRGPRLVGRVCPPGPGPLSRCPQSPPAFTRSARLPCGGIVPSPGAGNAAFPAPSEALGPWPPPPPCHPPRPGSCRLWSSSSRTGSADGAALFSLPREDVEAHVGHW